MSPEKVTWLSRDQIDEVLENLSADDLLKATAGGKGSEVAGLAFNLGAARLGLSNGTPATQHVRAGDFRYLAEKLGEVINVDSPLSEETSSLLDSADPGE